MGSRCGSVGGEILWGKWAMNGGDGVLMGSVRVKFNFGSRHRRM